MPINIGSNRIVEDGVARVSAEMAHAMSRHRLRIGDIVYSRRGDITRRALVRDEVGWLCGTGCLLVRPGSGTDPRWLSYWLGTPETHDWLLRHSVGATMPNLNTGILSALPVSLPPLDEQRRIAEVLGALDDLIDTNERQHEQLLALAFSVFHRAAFAAPLVELRHLGVAASRGVTPKYSADADSVVVVNQKCIRGFRVDLNQARRMEGRQARPEKVASPGDTLVNSTGVGTLGRSSRWLGKTDVSVDSHVTVVKAVRPEESAFVSYAVMSQVNNIEALAQGSTGQTELSKERLLGLLVPNLDGPLVASVGKALDELDQARSALLDEVRTLRRTRDELLPLLMSGKVRVRPEGVSA